MDPSFQLPVIVNKMLDQKWKNEKKPAEKPINFKRFKDDSAAKLQYFKEKAKKVQDVFEENLQKADLKKSDWLNVVPVPVDYSTFTKLELTAAKEKSGKSGKKGIGFGIGPRLPLSEKEKWIQKVPLYNSHSEKLLDPKNDNMPGPSAYSIISHWHGKKSKKDKENNAEKLPNYFKKVSKGPVINPYYAKLD